MRISNDADPPQQCKTTYAASQSTCQDDGRDPVAREADRFRQPFNRHGSVGIHLAIARGVGTVGGREQLLGGFELGHEAVDSVTIPKCFVHISPLSPRVSVWASPL